MSFGDIFYPGNPKRRQKIQDLCSEITQIIREYSIAWNNNTAILNAALMAAAKPGTPFYGVCLPMLTKDVGSAPFGDCLQEINMAIRVTKDQLDKLVSDIGIDQYLPAGWRENGVSIDKLNQETTLKICEAIGNSFFGMGAALCATYIFRGITVAYSLTSQVNSTASSILASLNIVLSGIVIGLGGMGGALISSAISGAAERKQLEGAIQTLNNLLNDVRPLIDAAAKLRGITHNIRNNQVYKLADGYVLTRESDGSYLLLGKAGVICTFAA